MHLRIETAFSCQTSSVVTNFEFLATPMISNTTCSVNTKSIPFEFVKSQTGQDVYHAAAICVAPWVFGSKPFLVRFSPTKCEGGYKKARQKSHFVRSFAQFECHLLRSQKLPVFAVLIFRRLPFDGNLKSFPFCCSK